jgi:hypothetical protein
MSIFIVTPYQARIKSQHAATTQTEQPVATNLISYDRFTILSLTTTSVLLGLASQQPIPFV